MHTLQFYFSFRSPYTWLAFYRLARVISALPVNVEYVPIFPPKDSLNNPPADARKSNYIKEDIERFAEAFGLRLSWPKPFDTDWIRPHAAHLFAQDQGQGIKFALSAYAARFSEGRDIGTDEVIAAIGGMCGLDASAVVDAADDREMQARVMKGMAGRQDSGVFGVPFFIYRGSKYWGNDRIEWLLRHIYRDAGQRVPDLQADPFTRPFG
jgi:2-hydroxychromene-2-carboxylate isomerase